jgi:hypothetical protein
MRISIMDQNIRLIEPNMAMFLQDHELKFYNLIYNRTGVFPSLVSSVGFENYMLVRVADGTMPQTSYPTMIELQTQVESLDYDGVYFWSVQPLNDTPYYPGTVIRKWEFNSEQYGTDCLQTLPMRGFDTGKALAIEYYNFPLKTGIDPSKKIIHVDMEYSYATERVREGQYIKIGPNSDSERHEYWGRVVRSERFPYDLNWPAEYWEIEFDSFFNASYLPGHNCFIEARLFVITSNGTLWEMDPTGPDIISTRQWDVFKEVNTLAFSEINHQPTVNLGNRTPALFFRKGLNVFCMQTDDCMDPDNIDVFVSCQSLPLHSYDGGNTYLPIYELRVRNDTPDVDPNYPQYYFLQQEYRESGSSSVTSWTTLNYVNSMIPAQPSFMSVRMDPEFLVPSGLALCRCIFIDDYRMPYSGATVNWSVSNTSAGRFLTATGTTTNISGVAYATFSGAGTIPFPSYIIATTTAM